MYTKNMCIYTDWYNALDIDGEEHPVTEQAFRVLDGDVEYQEVGRRLRTSLARLVELLEDDSRKFLFEYEESANHRSSLLMAAHFNLGVEHGRAKELVAEALTGAGEGTGESVMQAPRR